MAVAKFVIKNPEKVEGGFEIFLSKQRDPAKPWKALWSSLPGDFRIFTEKTLRNTCIKKGWGLGGCVRVPVEEAFKDYPHLLN